MKKYALAAVFFTVLLGTQAFAFEASDLKTYPRAVPSGSLAINLGIGFNSPASGNMSIPPISGSVDYALPIGGLPFSVGGIFGIYGSSDKYALGTNSYTNSWLYMSFGGRFGYHFNWGVDGLDTYAVFTLGLTSVSATVTVEILGNESSTNSTSSSIFPGFAIGGRYFFTPNIGLFLELGYSSLSFASVGVSFRL